MTWDVPGYALQTSAEAPGWHGPPKSLRQLKGNDLRTWSLWICFRPLAFGHWNPPLMSTSCVLKYSPNLTTILVKGDSVVSAKVTWCYVRCPKISSVDVWFIKKTSTGNIPDPKTSVFVVLGWTVSQVSIAANGNLVFILVAENRYLVLFLMHWGNLSGYS